jgi:hypothetical protein
MKERLPLFSSHLSVGITEYELYCLEEVTLSRTIAPDNDIVFRREGFCDSLILITAVMQVSAAEQGAFAVSHSPLETLYYDLLDVHL